MNCTINLFGLPTTNMTGGGGAGVAVLTDEAGHALSDEDGNFLTSDPEIQAAHGDENDTPLTDEAGRIIVPES